MGFLNRCDRKSCSEACLLGISAILVFKVRGLFGMSPYLACGAHGIGKQGCADRSIFQVKNLEV